MIEAFDLFNSIVCQVVAVAPSRGPELDLHFHTRGTFYHSFTTCVFRKLYPIFRELFIYCHFYDSFILCCR